MKTLSIPVLLLALGGCASSNVTLTPANQADTGSGPLQMVWLLPNTAEVQLDGKRYVGEWADSRCFTSACRGEFFNVPKIHRRHVRKGSAELVAQDATRLNCEWNSHDKKVIGTCLASDGRQFRLQGS